LTEKYFSLTEKCFRWLESVSIDGKIFSINQFF
jgi:hypothetical protein